MNWHWPHITRDVVLFVSGLGLLIYETVFRDTARPALMVVISGMMGLPAFLRLDEKRRNGKAKEEP